MHKCSWLRPTVVTIAWSALFVVVMAADPQVARAEAPASAKDESSITVYGGDRFGGSVTDATTNSTIDLQNGSSFGAAVDIGLNQNTQIELFYSQQKTALSSGAFFSQGSNTGLTFHNYQIGGTAFFDEVGRGLYMMGGIGGTTATPNQAALNSQTFFSGNVGVGWMVPLGAHVGLKFEARGYGILLNNDTALFCGGRSGCTVAVKGNGLVYGEVLAGLSVRF